MFSTWVMCLQLFKCLLSQESSLEEVVWSLPFPMPGAERDMYVVPQPREIAA